MNDTPSEISGEAPQILSIQLGKGILILEHVSWPGHATALRHC